MLHVSTYSASGLALINIMYGVCSGPEVPRSLTLPRPVFSCSALVWCINVHPKQKPARSSSPRMRSTTPLVCARSDCAFPAQHHWSFGDNTFSARSSHWFDIYNTLYHPYQISSQHVSIGPMHARLGPSSERCTTASGFFTSRQYIRCVKCR